MTATRRSESTHSVPPPPQGPRHPSYTRYPTAPPVGRTDVKEQIPTDKIAEVLRDPGYYCELYPDTLPLTRKLHQQASTQRLAASAPKATSCEPTQADTPPVQSMEGLCSEHPDVNGDEALPPSQGTVPEGFQTHRGERLPPLPVDENTRSASNYSDTTFAPTETGSVRHDEVVPPTHDRSQYGAGVRTVTVMDILEGGDWPLPYGIEMGDMLVLLP